MFSLRRVLAMFRACAVSVFILLCSAPAFADAIDGDWCGGDGKHLTIKGPEIKIPSGAVIQGNYRRHQFSYVNPAGEADAGMQIFLQLLNEEQMNFYRVKDGKPGEAELWQRCQITS
jgi:hypothetical protein